MTKLRMKCSHCGCWNRFEADKIFVQQPSPEPKVKVFIPMYKPLKTERCKKCGKVIAEPKELIRISALYFLADFVKEKRGGFGILGKV